MKIQRFNEAIEPPENEFQHSSKLSKDVNEFLDEFDGSVDNTIFDWVEIVSNKTKLKYPKFTSSAKNSLNFANNKNLKFFRDYITEDIKISQLEKEIIKIKKKRDKLYTLASNEVLLKFQEELIEKDFDSFWTIFVDEPNDHQVIDMNADKVYTDIHPDIFDKYKHIKKINDINIINNLKKYNL